MIEVIIATFAVYGVATLIAEYDSPFNIFHKIRSRLAVARCVVCLAVWVAIPAAIYLGLGAAEYLAVLGGVIFLDRVNL